MKKMFLTVILFFIPALGFAQTNSMSCNTSFPSPYFKVKDGDVDGVLSVKRINVKEITPNEPCDASLEGIYSKISGNLNECLSGVWTPLKGAWTEDSTNKYVYLTNVDPEMYVGIGTSAPDAKLHLAQDGGIIAEGTYGAGSGLTLAAAPTTMLAWIPKKAMFRAGYTSGGAWSDNVAGNYSAAFGKSTTATGQSSFAAGDSTNAQGDQSIAFGLSTIASGTNSIALGSSTQAIGTNSFSVGDTNTAKNNYSAVVGGQNNTVDGLNSAILGGSNNSIGAMGGSNYATIIGGTGNSISLASNNSYVLGESNAITASSNAIAIGYHAAITGGNNNFVIGNFVSTNGTNSLIMGGKAAGPLQSSTYANASTFMFDKFLVNLLTLNEPLSYPAEINLNTRITGTLKTTGLITASGGCVGCVALPSDERLKKDVNDLYDSLEKIKQLRGVSFSFRAKDFPEKNLPEGNQIGVIAQEVEKTFPDLVTTGADGYKMVDYSRLVAPLIEAVKELSEENANLKSALLEQKADLEQRLDELEKRIDAAGLGK